MERLTFEGNFCDIAQCRDSACKQDGTCTQKQVWERLKAYEDAGLSPQACAEAREIEETLSGCDYSISRMVELMKADKDGRLVVLPCKVTDELYVVGKKQIVGCDIAETYLNDDGTIEYLVNFECGEDCTGCPFDSWERESVSDEYHCGGEYGDGSVSSKDFGKTVFLTREEAEKALRKMQGKEDADGTDDKPE